MEYLTACPVCRAHDFHPFLSCKDYTVSHETFLLEQCATCGFVFTNPRPDDAALPRYYQSPSYISHSDKPTGTIDRAYKISRHFTLKWKYEIVQKHALQPPSSILDYGCGTGAFLRTCQQRSMRIAGVEPSPLARTQAENNTNTPIYSHASEIDQDFHAITLWHVLEHVSDLHGTLEKLKKHLTENGTMFIALPNLKSQDANRYKEHWAGYDVPRHLWHFSEDTLKKLLTSHRLRVITTLPMPLDAYYVSLLSEKYKNGSNNVLNMTRALHSGWKSNQAGKKTSQYSSLIYIVRK